MPQNAPSNGDPRRLPQWARAPRDASSLHALKSILRQAGLSTVCEEARCPNMSRCFGEKTATFLILGDTCTRACAFCGVKKGMPVREDPEEPGRVACAAETLGLDHVVITSVSRDDLPDRGAHAFAETIRAVRRRLPSCTVEVLVPDFGGSTDLLAVVMDENPDVLAHNVETTAELHPILRKGADLEKSLCILRAAKDMRPETVTKSGFMVGLGEDDAGIADLLTRLRDAACDVVTIGQYLMPTKKHAPVRRYAGPGEFARWESLAKSLGIRYCVAGPLVRSSYKAREILLDVRQADAGGSHTALAKETSWNPSR